MKNGTNFSFCDISLLDRTMTRCEEMRRDKHKNASRGITNSRVREENVGIIRNKSKNTNYFLFFVFKKEMWYGVLMKKRSNSIQNSFTVGITGIILGIISWIFPTLFVQGSPYSDSLINIIGTYGNAHNLWIFDTTGSGGNGGRSIFIEESEEVSVGWEWFYLDTTTTPQKFVGNFFLESVGWVSMENIELIPPVDMNVMTPWKLSWYAWSDNAGYIDMNEPIDGSYSSPTYTPGTKVLAWYAWSDMIGYVPFDAVTVDTWFKNKVKILGNIGSAKAFDTEYSLGVKFDSANTASIINTIRKNIALMTRSLPSDKMNTLANTNNFLHDFMYFKWSGIEVTDIHSKLNDNNLRSIIVEWGNIYINADITKDIDVEKTRSIIAIKWNNGEWWNIYIQGDVRNIYASLIAEWSIYSWCQSCGIYNDTIEEITQLPKDQLYIFWSVISRNTIGWSAKSPNPVCPFTENNCTYSNSYKYDWNYFRSYDPLNAWSTGSDKSGYDGYSIIIESDTRITWDPPPWLRQ